MSGRETKQAHRVDASMGLQSYAGYESSRAASVAACQRQLDVLAAEILHSAPNGSTPWSSEGPTAARSLTQLVAAPTFLGRACAQNGEGSISLAGLALRGLGD